MYQQGDLFLKGAEGAVTNLSLETFPRKSTKSPFSAQVRMVQREELGQGVRTGVSNTEPSSKSCRCLS